MPECSYIIFFPWDPRWRPVKVLRVREAAPDLASWENLVITLTILNLPEVRL